MAACGGAAADFKGYQLVGVNFLMLLARAGVGGAILADEMARGPPRACCCPLDERRPRIRLASLHDRRSVGAAPNVCTVVLAVDSAQRGALMMPLLANLYRLNSWCQLSTQGLGKTAQAIAFLGAHLRP